MPAAGKSREMKKGKDTLPRPGEKDAVAFLYKYVIVLKR
jgi:hypothetical protein